MSQVHLDATDLRILQILQKNASISQRELAQHVHVSPATALRRAARLKTQGIIEREVAILNPAHTGSFLQVIAEITLDKQDSASQDMFAHMILGIDTIQQCYQVSAGPDFILVMVVKDMAAYQQLARDIFSVQHNVRNVRAFFCTQRNKFTTQIPLTAAPPSL